MATKYFILSATMFAIISSAILAGFFCWQNLRQKSQPLDQQTVEITDPYVKFLSEVIDTIQQNYWQKMSEGQLADIYVAGINKLTNQTIAAKPANKEERKTLLKETIVAIDGSDNKKKFSTDLANTILANLPPLGRSSLYGSKEAQTLENRVDNRDTSIDLYKIMGIEKQASLAQLYDIYQQKIKEIDSKAPDAGDKKALLDRAYQTLSNDQSRAAYNQTGAEPTVNARLINPEILYLGIKMFSPATINEFATTTAQFDNGETLDTLILDLRDNVGGDIDELPDFLGPFIGADQYAYQFLRQDQRIDFKTKTGWLASLARYKQVVVLINGGTQSTAEVMAGALKRYNVGVLMGTRTKGWGTVERVFPLQSQITNDETYSVFLVHSLTLRDDNQPIEGQGVDPTINIESSDWETQLYQYFRSPELANAIKDIWNNN